MKATYKRHVLQFKRPSGTSRGILKEKETWFIVLENETKQGIGECGLLRGLSIDDRPDYEAKLAWVCDNIHLGKDALYKALTLFPSIQITESILKKLKFWINKFHSVCLSRRFDFMNV